MASILGRLSPTALAGRPTDRRFAPLSALHDRRWPALPASTLHSMEKKSYGFAAASQRRCCWLALITAQTAQAQVTLNLVNADIDQVAKAIGAATGKTIIVDPRVKGQLNLVSENAVPEDQALKTLQSALRMQGFALVQDHGVLKVVPEADAKLQGVPTYVGNSPSARGDQVVTQVFVLKNESANNLLPVLRPLISPNNTVAAYPANNTIVVTDYADNVRRIAQIIAGVDTAAGQSVSVVQLKNANALDIATQLNKMLDPGAIGSTDATLKVSITADPRTNSLLIRASNGARLAAARTLARELDAPTSMPGNMHVVPLRNAEATKLAKTLRGMLGKGGEGGSAGGGNEANAFNQNGGGGGIGGNNSTGTSGTPPLPSGGLNNSSLSSPMGGGGGAGGYGANGGGQSGGLLGGDKDKNEDNQPGGMIRADSATNSLIITASEPVLPQSARGDRPARRAPRAGLHRGAHRRAELEHERQPRHSMAGREQLDFCRHEPRHGFEQQHHQPDGGCCGGGRSGRDRRSRQRARLRCSAGLERRLDSQHVRRAGTRRIASGAVADRGRQRAVHA